jgi:hypothetical protein
MSKYISNIDYNIENNNQNDFDIEEGLFELKIFIKGFVYKNWKFIHAKPFVDDIDIELEQDEEDYYNEEEIYYKDSMYI